MYARIVIRPLAAMLPILLAVRVFAADFGNAMALYQGGRYPEAITEFLALANGLDADAMFILGDMYANGQGVTQDPVQAHKWYNLATAHGAKGAAQVRDQLAARMTAVQVADAQGLARAWQPGQDEPVTEAPAEPAPPPKPAKAKPVAPVKKAPTTAEPPTPIRSEPPPAPIPAPDARWAAAEPPPATPPMPSVPPAATEIPTPAPAAPPRVEVLPPTARSASVAVTETAPPAVPAPPAAQTPPPAATTTPRSGGFFANLARGTTGLFGRSPAPTERTATATIGIRGLSADELRSANPNPAAVQQMEAYRADTVQASSFARDAALAAQTVEYLPSPTPATTGQNSYQPLGPR
jgi:hypothetical protein